MLLMSRVPPLLTMVAPVVLPSAVALFALSTPPLIVTLPLKSLARPRVFVLELFCTMEAGPLILPVPVKL